MIATPEDHDALRASGRILAEALRAAQKAVTPGITTAELDTIAEKAIRAAGATPAFKDYHGYPAAMCVSINDEIVHTPPSASRKLQEGDIVSLDLGAAHNGFITDMAVTIPVGKASTQAEALMDATREALVKGIAQAQTGKHIGDISHAIQTHVESKGFGLVRTLFGHGVGRTIHEPPQIPNVGKPGTGDLIKEGMVLAIEPITTAGSVDTETLDDRWTIVTTDGSLAAHFEHTVLVTVAGPEILTIVQ